MRSFSYMVVVLAAFALTGCGAAQKKAAAPETDPWSDYKGTFAGGVPTKEELRKAEEADSPKSTKTAKNEETKTSKGSGKKIPEVKPADTRAPDVKPVPVNNDAKSMYNETGGDNAAADTSSDETPAPKKGGKKTGKKAGGKKAGGAKKTGGAAKK